MYDYHLNLFRPYRHDCRNEMSVTRSLMSACARSQQGQDFFKDILSLAVGAAVPTEDKLTFALEVPGGSFSGLGDGMVICIAQDDTIAGDDMLSGLYNSAAITLQNFGRVVGRSEEPTDLASFRTCLETVQPGIGDCLIGKSEDDIATALRSAYWDIWRVLYAGARADAVVSGNNRICLVECKIWGRVGEVQARNHAQEFFGTTQVPLFAISWQQVYDLAIRQSDPIIADFAEYLSEFPQLVRWNGFDTLDLDAFDMYSGRIAPEPTLQSRLDSRYWHCMEDLSSTYGYKVSARRWNDWDFTPAGSQFLGNTGIGNWAGRLSIKWCVGHHAWEMDTLMTKHNLLSRGDQACQQLADIMLGSPLAQYLSVEMRAVQRFQYINAADTTSCFGGPELAVRDGSFSGTQLQAVWRDEHALLVQLNQRRGFELPAADALLLKQELFRRRCPNNNDIPCAMNTGHQSWKLFAAFDVFVHINPVGIFSECQCKADQLTQIDKLVKALADFAGMLSR